MFCILSPIMRSSFYWLQEISPAVIPQATKIFVNGCWVGIHRNPDLLVRTLRLLRRRVCNSFSFLILGNLYIFLKRVAGSSSELFDRHLLIQLHFIFIWFLTSLDDLFFTSIIYLDLVRMFISHKNIVQSHFPPLIYSSMGSSLWNCDPQIQTDQFVWKVRSCVRVQAGAHLMVLIQFF